MVVSTKGAHMTVIDQNTSREELETLIVCGEKSLYNMFDEKRLLNGGYTTEQLRNIVTTWIEIGDECA